jgi:hypothetical protein
MQLLSRAAALIGLAALGTVGASQVLGNAGTLLPLDQYQAGTEQVQNTIVTNGNFENSTTDPLSGWTTEIGTFQTAAPIGANTSPAINGTKAAQGPLGGSLQRNGYQQSVTLAPNTDYVLSGYVWNFSPQNFDLTLVELRDTNGNIRNFALAPLDGTPPIDGSRGVFGYRSFNSGIFTGPVTLEVSFEYDAGFPFPQGRPSISAQIDNVAITPTAQFAPPQPIPEPASACLVGAAIAAGGCLARQRVRRG